MTNETTQIKFLLGWQMVQVEVAGNNNYSCNTTLLKYLRSLPGYRGTKEGCGEGDCGACTVLLGELTADGGIHYKAVNACLVLLPMVHAKQVITIEHISNKNTLHPLQKSFVEHHASQCGFCTPGFIMSAMALYKSAKTADEKTIQDHLSGNLCRCTGYSPIVEAVQKVCQQPEPDLISERETEVIKKLSEIKQETLMVNGKNSRYFQPHTLADLLVVKTENTDAVILNGATDQALKITKQFKKLEAVIDVSKVNELQIFEEYANGIKVGSGLCLNDLRDQLPFSLLAIKNMLNLFGSYQIRNLATIGGNIASASPIADLLPIFFILKAKVELTSVRGKREIEIDKFITGYRQTVLKADEIIHSIFIPYPAKDQIIKTYKVSKRKDLDISSVSAAFLIKQNNNEILAFDAVFGGMASSVVRASETCALLTGKQLNAETIKSAADSLYNEFKPIDDARATATGRRQIASNLLIKFFQEIGKL